MKKLFFVLIFLFVLSACAKQPRYTACTADAKLCPDGSGVGRIGPNCEFAKCPKIIACQEDARVCEDGNVVVRVAPNCEFEVC